MISELNKIALLTKYFIHKRGKLNEIINKFCKTAKKFDRKYKEQNHGSLNTGNGEQKEHLVLNNGNSLPFSQHPYALSTEFPSP